MLPPDLTQSAANGDIGEIDDIDNPLSWEPSLFFLKYGILVMLAGTLCFLVALGFVAPQQTSRGVGALLLILLNIVAWNLLVRGKIRALVFLLVVGVWSIITGVSVLNGGVRTPSIVAYPLIVMTAGWLISPRAAWIMATLCSLSIAGFVWTEGSGSLPKPGVDPAVLHGMVQMIIIGFSAMLVVFLVRSYRKRLVELNIAGLQLRQRGQELESIRADLDRAQAVASVGSWSFDLVCDTIWLPDETCRIFGLPPGTRGSFDAYMARVCREDRPALGQAWRAALQDGQFDNEHRIVCGEEILWIRQKAQLKFSPDGKALSAIGISQNITERKNRDAELIAARFAAEAANNAKSRFLAAASHDLRQPIAALSLYVGVLQNNRLPGEDALVKNIHECVESLSALLTDLLDVSKLAAGVVVPKLSDFPIDDMLASLISVHSAEAMLKGLKLRLRRSHATIRCDQQLLQRMLGNLIVNSINYTHSGGILVACRRHAGKVWIEVWDTGIGIPKDEIGVIFEEFRQLGDAARNRGSGLGLAIVAKTAALLGLQIRVRSTPGRGSLFSIEVPLGIARIAADQTIPASSVRPARIALVEDNAQVRRALALALEGAGHELVVAENGGALLEQLGLRAPDIVISDYRLAHGETGFAVITRIRAVFGNDLPALMITGDTDPELLRSMADRGIAAHHKPLRVEMLQAFVRQATKRRKSERVG